MRALRQSTVPSSSRLRFDVRLVSSGDRARDTDRDGRIITLREHIPTYNPNAFMGGHQILGRRFSVPAELLNWSAERSGSPRTTSPYHSTRFKLGHLRHLVPSQHILTQTKMFVDGVKRCLSQVPSFPRRSLFTVWGAYPKLSQDP